MSTPLSRSSGPYAGYAVKNPEKEKESAYFYTNSSEVGAERFELPTPWV